MRSLHRTTCGSTEYNEFDSKRAFRVYNVIDIGLTSAFACYDEYTKHVCGPTGIVTRCKSKWQHWNECRGASNLSSMKSFSTIFVQISEEPTLTFTFGQFECLVQKAQLRQLQKIHFHVWEQTVRFLVGSNK
jgi:hypothetical protein